MIASAMRYNMTSVLLSLTICTCSVKILNTSTGAGVYSFPSSVFFGGCVLSASRIFMYHFYTSNNHLFSLYLRLRISSICRTPWFQRKEHLFRIRYTCIHHTCTRLVPAIYPFSPEILSLFSFLVFLFF
jgi:hypothetical protein